MTDTNGIIKYSEGAMELQHFSHPHPLLLSLYGSVVEDGHRHYCKLCGGRLVSSGTLCYRCKDDGCNDNFYLHKSCAELPIQLQHPCHPKHPLTLKYKSFESILKDPISCDSCGRKQGLFIYLYTCSPCKFHLCAKCASLSLAAKVDIHDHPLILMRKLSQFTCDCCEKEGKGMLYFCATCSFMVHPQCTQLSPLVVRPLIIEAKIHQDHPLTLARKLNSFTCDACGKEGRGMFYFCVECSFVVHLRCASLPLHVKVIRHEHPLSLNIYSDPSAPAINPSSLRTVCRICVSMVDTDYMFYYCSTCHDFVAHLHCATCKEERDEGSVESSTSLLEHEEHGTDESTDMSPYVVIKRKLGVDGIEIDAEIKHFSHEHDLKLTDKFETKEKCDACTRYIFTNPYYACAQCRFFLHKYCAELERTMRHPLHEHRLKLIPRTTSELGYFRCWACSRFECNGFTYYCEKCDFNLDVQCSLLSYKYYTHDSHEHRLILSRLTEEGKKCNHCDSNDRKALFCCADCEFALDFKCLTLPHKVWYGQHEHPFTLCYAPEDDSGEYYCDICEEERDPRHWFYYCADCIYPIHPECILGKSPNIKPGKTYTIDNHQHPLTFHVKKTYDDGRDFMCKVCVYPIEHFGYQCAECNFIVHPVCLYKIGKSEG